MRYAPRNFVATKTITTRRKPVATKFACTIARSRSCSIHEDWGRRSSLGEDVKPREAPHKMIFEEETAMNNEARGEAVREERRKKREAAATGTDGGAA